MKKTLLIVFSLIVSLGFAGEVKASYTGGGSSFEYLVYFYDYCAPEENIICQNEQVAAWSYYDSMIAQFDALVTPGYQTNGYMVWRPYDTGVVGNTTLLTYGSPQTQLGFSCYGSGGLNLPDWGQCDTPPTYLTYSRAAGSLQRYLVSGTASGLETFYKDMTLGYLPETVCEFGVPLAYMTCPDLPNITAPASVPSGTPANISWTIQNTVLPGSSTNFIASCTVTSSPSVGSWSGLSNTGVASANLTSATTFTLRCLSFNGNPYTKSVVVNITAGTPPTVTSPTVSSITADGALLGANVISAGSTSITARGTCWGTSANPTTNCISDGNTSVGVFSHSRTGLNPSTTYYYRGYADNSIGRGYSADGTFTTLALPSGQSGSVTLNNLSSLTSPATVVMRINSVEDGYKDILVTINPPPAVTPSVTIDADSTNLPNGGSTILRWTYENIDSCEAYSPPISGSGTGSGSAPTGNLAGPNVYTFDVTCFKGTTTVKDSVTINVGP